MITSENAVAISVQFHNVQWHWVRADRIFTDADAYAGDVLEFAALCKTDPVEVLHYDENEDDRPRWSVLRHEGDSCTEIKHIWLPLGFAQDILRWRELAGDEPPISRFALRVLEMFQASTAGVTYIALSEWVKLHLQPAHYSTLRECVNLIEKAVDAAEGRPAACPGCLDGGDGQGHFLCSAVKAAELALYELGLLTPVLGGEHGSGWNWEQ